MNLEASRHDEVICKGQEPPPFAHRSSDFGLKAHVGSDPQGRVHSAVVTSASVHDAEIMEDCVHGEEKAIYGDKAYVSAERQQQSLLIHNAPGCSILGQAPIAHLAITPQDRTALILNFHLLVKVRKVPRSLLKRSKANLSRLVKEPLINFAFSKIHSPCWFMLFGLASLFPLLLACEQPTRVGTPPGYTVVESPAQMVVLDAARDTLWWIAADKFRHGASAAVSITYDAPFGTHPRHHLATAAVLQRDLRLDLEVVSAIYLTPRWRHLTDYYRTELMPQGIRFFGHGHTHALHDTMTFDAAYESFRTNFLLMQAWGLDPKGYAYPREFRPAAVHADGESGSRVYCRARRYARL